MLPKRPTTPPMPNAQIKHRLLTPNMPFVSNACTLKINKICDIASKNSLHIAHRTSHIAHIVNQGQPRRLHPLRVFKL
jgi:hypothetical protein